MERTGMVLFLEVFHQNAVTLRGMEASGLRLEEVARLTQISNIVLMVRIGYQALLVDSQALAMAWHIAATPSQISPPVI